MRVENGEPRLDQWQVRLDDERILRATFAGTITRAQAEALHRRLSALEDAGHGMLVDVRGIHTRRLTASDIRAFGRMPPIFPEGYPRAFLVGSTLGYGFARMVELLRARESDWRAFLDEDEALAWLRSRIAVGAEPDEG